MPTYRNISFATAASARDLLGLGANISVRGKQTKELIGRVTQIERPLERYLFVPNRLNDVVAQFAETLWVLAGRDDVAWLERYLPRAPDFSDDKRVWRGAYGPRLRKWAGIDQIDEVRKLLLADRTSRQGVMMLFDPARDFVASVDIPCNNWLSWIIRDDRLHLNTALRSNDLWWGFSGINAFEWSVLHEMLAHWVEADVGEAQFVAASLHLYDNHFERALKAVEAFHGLSPYDYNIDRARFGTSWEEFPARMARWFELEEMIRHNPSCSIGSYGEVGDPLLDSALTLVHFKWAAAIWDYERIARELAALPAVDYAAALFEFFGRQFPELLREAAQPPIAEFFAAVEAQFASIDDDAFKNAIKKLHAVKDLAYGAAWKRRGELVSVLPNIARKVDRLATLSTTGVEMSGEPALDTAIDLLVYAQKYRLKLAEELAPGTLLPGTAPTPLSDHEANFDALIGQTDFPPTQRTQKSVIDEILSTFENCWTRAEAKASPTEKLELASALVKSSAELVGQIVARDRLAVTRFLYAGIN
ncbi:thymidylate synthase [Mesorhizobium sp. M0902]|uniref:thymidylate synthase n=1 Tax=Mesorhizobium sp. M0902 TaxID=2957021 RepID=UPI003334BDFD